MSEVLEKHVYPKRTSWAYVVKGRVVQEAGEAPDKVRRFMVCEATRGMFGSTTPEDLVAVEAASRIRTNYNEMRDCTNFRLDVDIRALLQHLPRERWCYLEVKENDEEEDDAG